MKHTPVVYTEQERRHRLAAAYRILIEAAARERTRASGEQPPAQSDQLPS